jgi:Family of unknown function (DUF6533)
MNLTSVPKLILAVAFVVVLLYDYVLTFGKEASLLRSRWFQIRPALTFRTGRVYLETEDEFGEAIALKRSVDAL